MVLKISQWFWKLGMVPKIRDGLDLRNNYENVVILSTFGIFSKIARNAAETPDSEHQKETGNDWETPTICISCKKLLPNLFLIFF